MEVQGAMRDAVGAVQSVLVLGGGSEIAQAIVDRLVAGRCRTVVAAVRDPATVAPALERWCAAGATTVEAVPFDALDPSSHQRTIDDVFDRFGDIDLVIATFGVLGEQTVFDDDPVAAAEGHQGRLRRLGLGRPGDREPPAAAGPRRPARAVLGRRDPGPRRQLRLRIHQGRSRRPSPRASATPSSAPAPVSSSCGRDSSRAG